ncbi:P-loop ATPase, Sll1717 family [Methylomonas koyamae]|uniref:P-loop ATPase, Sll1717 family n=1 Tax=Methylomonas koyamae TaxID=702114 RepID=UPI000BC30F9F|nr:hypothetical protein [Methylomonas koyamae]ATG90489.1 hypothetical protein MKLM6_2263 [Methylomonas koyamae]
MHRRDLADPELFGNEAGEDEDKEVLESYFLEKPEFERFSSERTKLSFVRSRKGMGKSTLLVQTQFQRQKLSSTELSIYVKASDLFAIQDIKSDSPAELVYGWQQRICSKINLELGSTLNLAFTDDKIALVESAELAGFRNRNLVSALLDRLKVKGLAVDIERTRPSIANNQALLTRILSEGNTRVWIFIDDIDATFINTPHERLKVSTFFSACRNIVSTTQDLCIRASVRTDVWSILAQHDEAMDKCEQYMIDLKWTTKETGAILSNKISSFFKRYYPDDPRYQNLDSVNDLATITKLVFKEPFYWSGRHLEAFRPIHILSAGRPRWAAQLCKLAGQDAFNKNANLISKGHITSVLRRYGELRIADLYKEHRHQCEHLEDLIEAFSGGPKKYITKELLSYLTDKVITPSGMPKIDGISAEAGSMSVAHFLYRIGFITARDENDSTGLGFVSFDQRPNLLTTKQNLDDGLTWEIHPSYRHVLRIQKSATECDW